MNIVHGRIDVHHHVVPPVFVDAMNRKGIRDVAGARLPKWSPEASIAVMDRYGIQTAITSLSAPGVFFGSIPEARDLARHCNEYAAELRSRFPGRFGSFAVLPMPFAEHACIEAEYALDTLKADGIVLLGSTEGRFLGDAAFDELMAELDRREAVVFVHPNLHESSSAIALDVPGFLIEFLIDTTRAALNLIVSGTMERYPRIRWILAHAGGFLPYVAWRVSLLNFTPEASRKAPQGMLAYIKRFYFDTALSPSPYAMSSMRELVGSQQVVFGSDFPFAVATATGMQVETLDQSPIWDDQSKYAIKRGNAVNLFQQFRETTEVVSPLPVYASESRRERVMRALRSPIVAMAEGARKR